ncbi:MAG TPA: T9SS type A sorting domain-containing protein, partial [Bacteroidota bacterium]
DESSVLLKVYDVLGREVATLVQEIQPAGMHQTSFNARELPSGVYFYRIQAVAIPTGREVLSDVKKMVLTK